MQLAAALDDYYYAILDLSPRTRQWYEEKLRAFQTWADQQGTADLEAVTPALVRRYLAHLRDTPNPRNNKPLSTYTTHGYAQVIKTSFGNCSTRTTCRWAAPRLMRCGRLEHA